MDPWKLTYDNWHPQEQGVREALMALGNGYFVTRGAFEESSASDIHYPGTYLAGGYNRLQSTIGDKIIEHEDLVNWPNWLCLKFRINNGKWFDLLDVNILEFNQELNIKKGLLNRFVKFKDDDGNITELTCKRFVSMYDEHLAGIKWELVPKNWSSEIEVRSGLDGNIINNNVYRYKGLNNKHLEVVEKGKFGEEIIYLKAKSNQSNITMAQASRLHCYLDGRRKTMPYEIIEENDYIAHKTKISCNKEKTLTIEKIVSLYTSRDWAISEAGLEAQNALERAGDFEDLLQDHENSWKKLWRRCDIKISGDPYAQMVLRLHIFHLLQTASYNTIDLDAGIPARGLHGEGYRGHIFWDELFIFPFLNMRLPEITRELLMYRFRRLREAKFIAKESGGRGVCFPWQSGSNGREETTELLQNPISGKWLRDNTHLQRHINAAIAYNVWQYYQASGDQEFMAFYGAKISLEIALYFASIATYNTAKERYEIRGVVGPDEYHTSYPGATNPGLNNNAYTNIMASWVLHKVKNVLELLSEARRRELLDSLRIEKEELERWNLISRKMLIPFLNDKNLIISQFEGYDTLKEIDWQAYRKKYFPHRRLDFILDAEGDSVGNYKASKQADVLVLFYIFSYDELKQIFEYMGYHFPKELIPANIEYYKNRTTHDSTLSNLVHSWILARSDRANSWSYFREALKSDIEDISGGTTKEGIHLGAMAGVVDMMQRCYTGMEIRNEILYFNPALPDHLNEIATRLRYRGNWLQILLSHKKMEIIFEEGIKEPITIGFKGKLYPSAQKDSLTFEL